MLPPRPARVVHILSAISALTALIAVAAALAIPDPYAAVPERLRPGAWTQDAIAVIAALGVLWCNRRLRQGLAGYWPLWAGFLGYLIYAYGLYAFDRVINPLFPLYLIALSTACFAAFVFLHHVDPAALPRRAGGEPPRRATAALFVAFVAVFASAWLAMLIPSLPGRAAIPEITILVLDLTFALPLLGTGAVLLWRARPGGDVLAAVLLVKVATLGLSVFLGTAYAVAAHGAAFVAFELALYAAMTLLPAWLLLRWLGWIDLGARFTADRA